MSRRDNSYEYDVFLSFRGPDTRQGFTDCLYQALVNARLRVFKDDEELRLGDDIQRILEAVDNSRICIPILSKKFGSSAWCLREVERMVENKQNNPHIDIVPVFYDVTTDQVKQEDTEGSLCADAEASLIDYGQQQLLKWKEALQKIPTYTGEKLDKKDGFTDFIEKLVNKILSKLSTNSYEVFLSVSPDTTLQGFGNCLYRAMVDAKIKVFIVQNGIINPGTEAVATSNRALDTCKICVVIFSKSYPDYARCLREVARMVDKKKLTIPIYYDVNPYADTRLQTHPYVTAFNNVEFHHGKEQAIKWKQAIYTVSRSRKHILGNAGFADYSKEIVADSILPKLEELRSRAVLRTQTNNAANA